MNVPSPLLHTVKGRQRVIAALRWDPREEAGFIDKLRGRDKQHDLDIACFLFNEAGHFAGYVGAEAQDSMDASGAVYHSGDDMTGEGNTDDESVSAELAALPPDIAHLIFLVEVRSGHSFAEVRNPAAYLTDGLTHDSLLDMPIMDPGTAKAFVFARLYRSGESETGWLLHPIGEYPEIEKIEDWGVYLERYTA